MRKTIVASVLGVVTLVVPLSGHAADPAPFTLKSVSVNLPTDSRLFPPGPNVETVNNNCLTCHSAGMVLNQPPLSKTAWEAEVHKMIDAYGAPVQPLDVPLIVAYLDSINGAKSEGSPPMH